MCHGLSLGHDKIMILKTRGTGKVSGFIKINQTKGKLPIWSVYVSSSISRVAVDEWG